MAASGAKIRKIEDDIFTKFQNSFLKDEPNIVTYLDLLKSERYAIAPLEIVCCNAADPALGHVGGVCFSKATCTMVPKNAKRAFANFFVDAFKMLKTFLRDSCVPDDEKKRIILSRLLKFLMNKDIQKPLCTLGDLSDETELSVLSTFHLFSQLSASPAFTIDKNKSNKMKWCPCGKRHAIATYGDNSIGDPSVWHGQVDVIMEGAEIIIETLDGEETVKDIESDIEVKKCTNFQFDDLSPTSCISQVAAKTIVYSFYHRKLHPENMNSLIPCIGICEKGLVFYFYDSVHDVMLGSTLFYLTQSVEPDKLNFTAVIALWMVLNYKHFCDGSSCASLPKAGFLRFAEKKIDIYKNELRRGDVSTSCGYASVDPLSFNTSDFLVARELEEI